MSPFAKKSLHIACASSRTILSMQQSSGFTIRCWKRSLYTRLVAGCPAPCRLPRSHVYFLACSLTFPSSFSSFSFSFYSTSLSTDLLHPSAESTAASHKLKRLVQAPNSFFMVSLPPTTLCTTSSAARILFSRSARMRRL